MKTTAIIKSLQHVNAIGYSSSIRKVYIWWIFVNGLLVELTWEDRRPSFRFAELNSGPVRATALTESDSAARWWSRATVRTSSSDKSFGRWLKSLMSASEVTTRTVDAPVRELSWVTESMSDSYDCPKFQLRSHDILPLQNVLVIEAKSRACLFQLNWDMHHQPEVARRRCTARRWGHQIHFSQTATSMLFDQSMCAPVFPTLWLSPQC